MNNSQKITLEFLKREYSLGLLIPEIQRDYVMGAGGKSNNGSDKLDLLLDAFLRTFHENKAFDFSCIITYCKNEDHKNERLEIYDGQQRLTTLILLYLFCLQREKNEDYKKYAKWYQFCGRPLANEIIAKLTEDNFNINTIEVVDFSSFSMVNLLKRFNVEKYKEITSNFFLQCVEFDHVSIGNQSEIEQFFMDLNSGVKLKEYELYKAKLVHHINCITGEKEITEELKEVLITWIHKLDNEWLNAFLPFSDFVHSAEEYEIAFLRYCFRMLNKDKSGAGSDRIETLKPDILNECYYIMNAISKLSFPPMKQSVPPIVEFSWGTEKECSRIKKKYWECDESNQKRRCAYWNLNYEDHLNHLSFIIKNVLLKSDFSSELDRDVLVWAYITSLDRQMEYQNEYMRILKILLNHNVGINLDAWYECQAKGQYLYYAKYGVLNIPDYYGIHIKPEQSNAIFELDHIYALTEIFRKNKPAEDTKSKQEISERIMTQMAIVLPGIQTILDKRKSMMRSYADYESFCIFENKSNGVLEHPVDEGKNYLADVKLSWPIRGAVSCYGWGKGENKELCWVMLKCYMDKCYSAYNDKEDNLVQYFENKYSEDMEFDKEKVFWGVDYSANSFVAYRIMDRSTATSKTYIKRGGSDNYYWAYKFDGRNPRSEV